MRNTPKTPPKPKPAPALRNEGSTTPDPARQPDQRWQRTVRYGWDKGGSQGGRK